MKFAPVNEPEEFVLVVPLMVTVDPANVPVRAELPAKPKPDTVTVEPTFPLIGLREMDGVTVNVAVAAFELASVAVTVFPPAV